MSQHHMKNGTNSKRSNSKIYTKEINSLIEKILKNKRHAIKVAKPPSHHTYQQQQIQLAPKIIEPSISPTSLAQPKKSKEIKTIKVAEKSQVSRGSKIQLTDADNSLMGELSNKVGEYTKMAIAYNRSNLLTKPTFLPEILSFVKQERNTSALIENDEFFLNLLQMIKNINFAPPKYTVTDSKYEAVDDNLAKAILEDLIMTEDPAIRIKDENWVHILNLYEIFIELLNNFNATEMLLEKLPNDFLGNLLNAFQTLDPEVRMIIKMIIYKIYSCSMNHREDIVKFFKNKIIDITHDATMHIFFLGELLELMKCIIQGAMKPISEKYISLVTTVICPLLKTTYIKSPYLKETIVKLSTFDDKIAVAILTYLSMTWPIRYPERILSYLDIIETLLLNVGMKIKEEPIIIKILKKIKLCFGDMSFQIADRSLVFFKNDAFFSFFYFYDLQKPFMEALANNLATHWSQEIKIISRIAISKLLKHDEKIMNELTKEEVKIIEDFKFDINESEDIWDIHFNLKVD